MTGFTAARVRAVIAAVIAAVLVAGAAVEVVELPDGSTAVCVPVSDPETTPDGR